MNEDDLFQKAMSQVQPLEKSSRIQPARKKPVRVRASAQSLSYQEEGRPASLTQKEPWILVADGVSRDRLRQLAAGRPPVARSFDLHGMSREEALKLLQEGIGAALAAGERVVCIIHGRGLHSADKPILKHAVYHWLQESSIAAHVLACIPQPGSGGGACLVLLRRNGRR